MYASILCDKQWRAARSELGPGSSEERVIILNEEELKNKKFSLEYNCSEDCYSRGSETVKGWSAYANHNGSIQRKVESDWKMAYLCREESEVEGEAYWSIDLCDVKVKSFRLQLFGKTIYENGSVVVTVCAGDICYPMAKDSNELVLDEAPSAILKISARLSGGKGNNAFQHAQLFRTPLGSTEPQMKIDIELE